MVVSLGECMVLFHIQSQKNKDHQDGKPSTTMGKPSFGAVESIRSPNCTPPLCVPPGARSWG